MLVLYLSFGVAMSLIIETIKNSDCCYRIHSPRNSKDDPQTDLEQINGILMEEYCGKMYKRGKMKRNDTGKERL